MVLCWLSDGSQEVWVGFLFQPRAPARDLAPITPLMSCPRLPWVTQAREHFPFCEDLLLTVGVRSTGGSEALALAGDFPLGRGVSACAGS